MLRTPVQREPYRRTDKLKNRCFLLWYYVLLFGIGLQAQEVRVVDEQGHSSTVTAERLAKLPHVTLDVTDHGTPAKFEGAPLSAVLSSVGISLSDTLKGQRLSEGLLVEASDGYKVLFALAETDPAFATREIILADKRDGKALDAKEGPFRVVAPGDKRPARWIRQVTIMKLVLVRDDH
jgi:hypothetical protein